MNVLHNVFRSDRDVAAVGLEVHVFVLAVHLFWVCVSERGCEFQYLSRWVRQVLWLDIHVFKLAVYLFLVCANGKMGGAFQYGSRRVRKVL